MNTSSTAFTQCVYGYLHLENTKDQRKTHWAVIQVTFQGNIEMGP
jgi:hypothetical protein